MLRPDPVVVPDQEERADGQRTLSAREGHDPLGRSDPPIAADEILARAREKDRYQSPRARRKSDSSYAKRAGAPTNAVDGGAPHRS
jgi:hypothetical protein